MTTTLLTYMLAGTALVIAAILLLQGRMPWRVLGGLGLVFVLAGIGAVGVLEWQYSASRTEPVSVPVALDRAGAIEVAPFTAAVSGPFELSLQFDHTPGIAAFGCLAGEDDFEALCPGRTPELDIGWTVRDAGAVVAQGGSDLAGWHRRQAALDPRAAAARRRAFQAYMAKAAADPTDNWPLYHSIGIFRAEAGHTYAATLSLRRPATALAAFHPRLIVALSSSIATKGIGALMIGFCLLCVVGGSLMLLFALSARKARAVP